MNTALEQLLSTPEGRTALCIEQTITNVTELLCKHLEESRMKRGDLARAMGVSPGRVSQLLDGNANLTLASIARALAVFGQVLEAGSVPVEQLNAAWQPTLKFGDWQHTFDPNRPHAHCSEVNRPAAQSDFRLAS